MNAFISFADRDHRLVHMLAGILMEAGIDASIASQSLSPGTRLDDKVKAMIAKADCVVVLLTPHAVSSGWVQQEIGCAKALAKHIVPLKSRNVAAPAMLEGIEYVQFKLGDPAPAFHRVCDYLCTFADNHGLARRKAKAENWDEFHLLHLPHAMVCPDCKSVEVHVWICFLCGEWVCVTCGGTIPPSSRAVTSASRATK